jgi:hypothetical protein
MSEEKLIKISVEPNYKKSISEIQTWYKEIEGEKYWITMDQGWRWGKWVGEVTEEQLAELKEDSENGVCEPDIYEGLVLDYLDDGVWLQFEGSKNVTEEMLSEFEELFEEDGYSGVEGADWVDHDCEIFINTGLNIIIDGEGGRK